MHCTPIYFIYQARHFTQHFASYFDPQIPCILFTLHLYALDVLRTVYEPIPELYIYIVNNLSLLCACPITIIIISITMHAYTIG